MQLTRAQMVKKGKKKAAYSNYVDSPAEQKKEVAKGKAMGLKGEPNDYDADNKPGRKAKSKAKQKK
jgi:hypothetical protein